MKSYRSPLIYLGVLILFTQLTVAADKTQRNPTLDFSFSGYANLEPKKETTTRWIDKKTLVAKAYFVTSPSYEVLGGSYTIKGNELNLIYIVNCPTRIAQTVKQGELVFKFSDLSQRDYKVRLVERKECE